MTTVGGQRSTDARTAVWVQWSIGVLIVVAGIAGGLWKQNEDDKHKMDVRQSVLEMRVNDLATEQLAVLRQIGVQLQALQEQHAAIQGLFQRIVDQRLVQPTPPTPMFPNKYTIK